MFYFVKLFLFIIKQDLRQQQQQQQQRLQWQQQQRKLLQEQQQAPQASISISSVTNIVTNYCAIYMFRYVTYSTYKEYWTKYPEYLPATNKKQS